MRLFVGQREMREADGLVRVTWDICEGGKGRKAGRAARRVVGESVKEMGIAGRRFWRSGERPVRVWKFCKTEEVSSIYVDGYQLQL